MLEVELKEHIIIHMVEADINMLVKAQPFHVMHHQEQRLEALQLEKLEERELKKERSNLILLKLISIFVFTYT